MSSLIQLVDMPLDSGDLEPVPCIHTVRITDNDPETRPSAKLMRSMEEEAQGEHDVTHRLRPHVRVLIEAIAVGQYEKARDEGVYKPNDWDHPLGDGGGDAA